MQLVHPLVDALTMLLVACVHVTSVLCSSSRPAHTYMHTYIHTSSTVQHNLVGVIYHPPNANSRTMVDMHIVNCVDEVTREPIRGVAVLGDFNRLQDGPLRNYPLRQGKVTPGLCLTEQKITAAYCPVNGLGHLWADCPGRKPCSTY